MEFKEFEPRYSSYLDLKVFNDGAVFISQGKSFHGETTLWLKKCLRISVLQNFPLSERGFSDILVILLDVSANIENQVHLITLLTP